MASKKASQPAGGSEQGKIPPGFKLRHRLSGHTGYISRIAWSPDGRTLASGSNDHTIRLWDIETAPGTPSRVLAGHSGWIYHVAWSPDGRILASCSGDKTIRLWDTASGSQLRTLEGHLDRVFSLAWSPDGRILASGSGDNTIRLWDSQTGQVIQTLYGHGAGINELAWFRDKRLASGSYDQSIRLWDPLWDGKTSELTRILQGHTAYITSVAWSPDGRVLASCAEDKSIRLWDPGTGRQTMILEGHTEAVTCVSFSFDGQLLASKSWDGTVRLWRAPSWDQLIALHEPSSDWWPISLRFHPTRPVLATLGEGDTVIRIWDLDLERLLSGQTAMETTRYTTAKLVLVGDSGVGKTGLGWRLAHGQFKEHASTHGQQCWVLNELGTKRQDGTECEAVLWDFAGQPDYRLVHALFLDDVDLALVLFDPTNQQEPLKGVEYWLKQLAHRKGHPCGSILVGARADRGGPAITREELEAFCRQYIVKGGYLSTSALTSGGVDELLERLKAAIDWDTMPATVTTQTFKRVKKSVLALKADTERKGVLVRPNELRARLEATDTNWSFSDAEMLTAVGHLANHGYVTALRSASGDETILLEPALLANLAASIVLEARRNPRGLGALEEARVLAGSYPFPELAGLEPHERAVLLDAATALFVERHLCFRETLGADTFLVFPALINQKRPLLEDVEIVDDVSYQVAGAVENVYAALVVLLGYTNTFTRTHQWQNQAQYEMGRGEVFGFRQVAERENQSELVLYYGTQVPPHARLLFQGLFETFLRARDVTVTKYTPVDCPQCGYRQERSLVVRRLQEDKNFLICGECGARMTLQVGEEVPPSRRDRERLAQDRERSRMRTTFESALVRVKALVRDRGDAKAPICFISYAWDVPEHERWVQGLATDLQNAGLDVVVDQRDNSAIGANVARFVSRIEASDFVVVVGTPLYRQKYENKVSTTGSVVAAEVDLIHLRLMGTEEEKNTVLPLLLNGDDRSALPPLLRGRVYANFLREELYFASLFDLILTLYGIRFNLPAMADLREALQSEATMRR